MSKVSHLPKNVPSKEIPFKFKTKGSITRFQYEGEFIVRVPSTKDMGAIGVQLARLNDGVPLELLDKSTAALHNSIAFLKITLVQAPNWFQNSPTDDEEGMDYGLETVDVNIPIEIFRQADKLVQGWYDSLKGVPSNEESAKN